MRDRVWSVCVCVCLVVLCYLGCGANTALCKWILSGQGLWFWEGPSFFFPGKCARVMGGRFYGNKLGKMRCTSMLLWWLEVDKIFMTFLRSYFRELSFEK